jgi:hypothetical protein
MPESVDAGAFAVADDINSGVLLEENGAKTHGQYWTCPECVDATVAEWKSPDGWGSCATYRIGGLNEGYCDIDGAAAHCPVACDVCKKCYVRDAPTAQ